MNNIMEGKMMNKRLLLIVLTLTFGAGLALGDIAAVYAQESNASDFTLEEITVTAEKRAVNIQTIPSSVVALDGNELAEMGKITTAQILETVPNVRYGGAGNANADGGIAIRGVSYKTTSDGQPPSATATYVDGVFQGIGGNYDLSRVEVLRGPQGTLYGRSATGGVVAFYTNNPKLSEFGGSVSGEIGTASLKNIQASINIPAGEKFAIRAAGRFLERDGYDNPDGGWAQTKEGRIKALYQPTDAFKIVLSGSISDQVANAGGYSMLLVSPTTVFYKSTPVPVQTSGTRRSTEGALNMDYDFGDMTLTYIGSLRKYVDADSPPLVAVRPNVQIMNNLNINYGEHFTTHELRLASDSEGPLQWLVGGNYYNSDYKRNQISVQHTAYTFGGVEITDPATIDALIFEQPVSGDVTNYGLFTEETYSISDDMRFTGGLRYDKTTVHAFSAFNFNGNVGQDFASLKPTILLPYQMDDSVDFRNITYKLRFEYDLTPNNMLYALTATGFQPGDLRLTNKMVFNGPPPPSILFFSCHTMRKN
jgi:outer membrane receptor protein involved in Fe transport